MTTKQATMDPRVDLQVEGAPAFARPILRHLRGLVHAACAEVEETIRWGRPFFLYRGRMVCTMAVFKAHCSFRFWQPEMAEIVRASGLEAKDAAGSFGRITGLGDLPPDKQLLKWLKQAFELAATGKAAAVSDAAKGETRRPRTKAEVHAPDDLAAELAKRDAGDRFAGLSSSCRREYVQWIEEAKRAETRARRVMEAAGWIAEGKRRNWKYEGG